MLFLIMFVNIVRYAFSQCGVCVSLIFSKYMVIEKSENVNKYINNTYCAAKHHKICFLSFCHKHVRFCFSLCRACSTNLPKFFFRNFKFHPKILNILFFLYYSEKHYHIFLLICYFSKKNSET